MSELIMISETGEYSTAPVHEANIQNVRNIVNKDAHPHPMILVSVTIILVIVIYYLYVISWKTCFNGKWVDSAGDILYIKHNKWDDSVTVEGFLHGHVKGDAIYLVVEGKMNMGVLYDSSIYWLNHDVWTRPTKLF